MGLSGVMSTANPKIVAEKSVKPTVGSTRGGIRSENLPMSGAVRPVTIAIGAKIRAAFVGENPRTVSR